MESLNAGGVIAQARDLVEDYVKADIISVAEPSTGITIAAVRRGNDIAVLPPSTFDPYRRQPLFRTGSAVMLSLDSLIEHANRFKDDDSVVFADDSRTNPSIIVVLDYHRAGAVADPRFGKHRSTFTFPLSDEWKAWVAKNAEPMGMVDFAAFLEERIIDVLYVEGEDDVSEDLGRLIDTLGGRDTIATPNKLMELARGLQINEAAVVQEAVNLASGEGIVRFQSAHTDEHGAPIKVPGLFLIGIPVFRNGPLYRVAARLRYRKSGGKIVFWYELWRTDRTFDHAFKESVERVKADTGLPVLIGKPEA